jgi:glycosyltransferase involved in cell wall biosynthesis
MKIGFISTVQGHQWPGSEYLWSACAGKLLAQQHQVQVWANADLRGAKALASLTAAGAAVHFVARASSRMERLKQKFINPLDQINSAGLDLLVVSSGSAYDPVYLPALGQFLQKARVPFIFICHFNAETFWVDEIMRAMMSDIFQKAAQVIFVSRDNRRLTERQLGMRIPRACVIVPPLHVNGSGPLPWPEADKEGPWRLACVARLEPRWKGQDVLFEVLSESSWKNRNFHLSLYGQGEEESYLRKLARYYGLDEKIEFAGFASPEKIWANHHLQVLSARGEGGPMVVTEGMWFGRVAVTTRCGFLGEYVRDGENGFLADFASPVCFGKKLEEAWNRRVEWQTMGLKAHQFIKERLGDFNASDRLLKLIITGSPPAE